MKRKFFETELWPVLDLADPGDEDFADCEIEVSAEELVRLEAATAEFTAIQAILRQRQKGQAR